MNNILTINRLINRSLISAAIVPTKAAFVRFCEGGLDLANLLLKFDAAFFFETQCIYYCWWRAQWQERQSWLANFSCRTLDLQLMGDHLCG